MISRSLKDLSEDILITEILPRALQDKDSPKFLFKLALVDQNFRVLTRDPILRSTVWLYNEHVFDATKTPQYINFITDCSEKGNQFGSLLCGLSMCFCFGQVQLGKYHLKKIYRTWPIAALAYAFFALQEPENRSEVVALFKILRSTKIPNYADMCRIQLLHLLSLRLQYFTQLNVLEYGCSAGENCPHHGKDEVFIDDQLHILTCADKYNALEDYNKLRTAFKAQRHGVVT